VGRRADNPSGLGRFLEVGASADEVFVLDCIDCGMLVKIVDEQQITASLDIRQPFGIERLGACRVEPLTGGDVQKQTLAQKVIVIEPPRAFQTVLEHRIPSFRLTAEQPHRREQHLGPGEQHLVVERGGRAGLPGSRGAASSLGRLPPRSRRLCR
jgi:hypothetical protein